ncbi:MAG TPA: polyprenol monophosphomannose synthase [Chitinophagales bacterium]|nr:polyprenol monophosphomannose synthase [Chitinophagales bacterium]HMZ89436.1 polyprenol monophosphomannose synthase [Chitinophagales bacterium]HNE45042.1 polyprenol monophosphomannose synthase [Chitinophagales bacterium]HNF68110.1 polyprenol monophosphomannose synthase [Chitinophagales bacterium]HNI53720.1 polyprenol monophosphomannose synthase [Chitinophagales bacterium]
MARALVIIPTYNEQANIADMITAVLSLPQDFDLLIIDDNSPDGTASAVTAMQSTYPTRLHLHQRAGKLGLGTAYIAGFKWGLAQGYDYMIEMDADFSHKPEDLPRLLDACKNGADVAIGSRYIKGGNVEDWPTDRILLSKWASRYVRMITWIPVHDTTAGFVCYKRNVLDTIDLDKIRFIGYAFQIELKYAAWRSGFSLKEIPIVFKDRQKGISKMSKGIFKEAVYGVITMRWKSFFHSYTK